MIFSLRFLTVALFSLILGSLFGSEYAVTYQLSEGRLGDRLQAYLHAKWISYCYNIPLLYKPFEDSDEFALHEMEALWSEEKEKSFDHVIRYTKDEDFPPKVEGSVLYVVPFFSELENDQRYQSTWIYFPVNWKDEKFVSLLRPMVAPRNKRLSPAFPVDKNTLTVALHVRRGGGADHELAHLFFPLRFVPDSYYIESLRRLSVLFPGRPIYAYVFTDDPEPIKMVERYQEALSDLPITFGCRKEGNRHNANVIEDFFAMMQFDCLIRTQSNYSLIPAVVGRHRVVMTPQHCTMKVLLENNKPRWINEIDQIDVEIREDAIDL